MDDHEAEKIISELNLNPEQSQRLWNWLLHEDQLFATRTAHMLTIQSILAATWAAFGKEPSVSVVLAIAGIFASIIWHEVTTVQVKQTQDPLKQVCKRIHPEYAAIKNRRNISTNQILGKNLPKLVGCFWVLAVVTTWFFRSV
ncbi:MAG: hypothetical protein ACRBB4_01240 [Neptuniibacter sp.]